MMVIILAIRITILSSRVLDNLHTTSKYQYRIDHLHIGYFTSIAIVESSMLSPFHSCDKANWLRWLTVSSTFLLRIFLAAKRTSLVVASKGNLFQHLVRSTEIRVASLGIVGITRAITYTFQTTAQSAESVANEVDRFAYTLECMFPMLLMFVTSIHRSLLKSNAGIGLISLVQKCSARINIQKICHHITRVADLNESNLLMWLANLKSLRETTLSTGRKPELARLAEDPAVVKGPSFILRKRSLLWRLTR